MKLVIGLLALVACGNDDEVLEMETIAEPCSVTADGSIPGVSITISSSSCEYARGQPATFEYAVTVTGAVPAIAIPDSQSCSCDHRNTQIDSWLSWVIVGQAPSGDYQQYCLCDTGCCAPQDATTITPEVGTFTDTIEWNGRTWQGPSDTGNEPGDYFLVGTYGVTVRFHGYTEGSVEGTLPIVVY